MYTPFRSKLNRLSNDKCQKEQRTREAEKPLKYYTRNFGQFEDSYKMKGLFFHDGHTRSCDVNASNGLREINTNVGLPQSLPALPLPTTGARYGGRGQGDTDQEALLWGKDTNGDKTCLPSDPEFYNRSFADFSSLCRKPQELKHTVQKGHAFRGGISTREILQVSSNKK